MNPLKKVIKTTTAPAPGGPYSQAIVAGQFVFVSGQGPMHHETRAIIGEDVAEQTKVVINNVSALLKEAGSSWENVVKCNIFLSDNSYFKPMNEVYKEMVPGPWPARTTVACDLRGILMEMEVIALLDE